MLKKIIIVEDVVSETLGELIQQLHQASTSKNWELLEKFDVKIKQSIEAMTLSASSAVEKEKLSSDLKTIQKIYTLVINDSKKHQLEIATELKKNN